MPTAKDGGSADFVGNNYLPTAKDGGSADFAGNNYLPTAKDGGSADFAGSNYLPTAKDGGSADFAGSKNLPTPQSPERVPTSQPGNVAACAANVSLDYRVKPDNDDGVRREAAPGKQPGNAAIIV
ncbi:hypothetical protein [Candidatus Spongiihabitans sp.]|uniref:hypothetical protein n=1 Tax=Candidatus Spongiihabitans sp. TaxID=3101308 RepID=UPI003C7A8EF0